MDRLTAMAVFVAVVERGSLSKAADALDMSRAMVTRHLAELESWLDARLLHRTTRRLALTAAGEIALERCRAMLALGEGLQATLRSDAATPRGRLRLTCSTSFGISVLAALVAEYTALHPQTAIDLLQLDRTVNLVEERMDLAIRIARVLDSGLVGRQLSVCRSVLCASPAYLAHAGAQGDPVAALMTCAPQNAWFSVINGRARVEAGKLASGIDLPDLIERHNRISAAMLARSGWTA